MSANSENTPGLAWKAIDADTAVTFWPIQKVLASPSASNWIKGALRSALSRDCVDAARDAEFLATLLSARADELLRVFQGLESNTKGR